MLFWGLGAWVPHHVDSGGVWRMGHCGADTWTGVSRWPSSRRDFSSSPSSLARVMSTARLLLSESWLKNAAAPATPYVQLPWRVSPDKGSKFARPRPSPFPNPSRNHHPRTRCRLRRCRPCGLNVDPEHPPPTWATPAVALNLTVSPGASWAGFRRPVPTIQAQQGAGR